jgi:phosphatidylserine/phosphatidylglycerophosphate/cardiolipin synthase-like enzyme
MAAFRRLVDPSQVQVAGQRLVTLPDRYLTTPAPPRVARYEGRPIWLAEIVPQSSGNFDLFWPVTGGVRTVDLTTSDGTALGIASLVELAPLPFEIDGALRALRGGVPTFYIGYPGTYPADHEIVRTTDAAVSVNRLLVGVVFQDRLTRATGTWIQTIGDALTAVDPAQAAAWLTQLDFVPTVRTIQMLDAAGRPLAGEHVTVSFVATDGSASVPVDAVSDVNGLLGPETNAPAGAKTRIASATRELPLLVHVEGAITGTTPPAIPSADGSTLPALDLPAAFTRAHVQLADVGRWLAAVTPPPPAGAWPARFRPRSVFEPLVDGHAAYSRLVPDLKAANVAGGGAYFMGWAFKDFELRPGDPQSSLPALVDSIRQGGHVRILAAQMFQPVPGSLDNVTLEAALVLLVAYMLAYPEVGWVRVNTHTNLRGTLVFTAAFAAAVAIFAATHGLSGALENEIRGFVEETSDDLMARLNRDEMVAFFSRHPARFEDNPLFHDIPLPDGGHLSDLQDKFSVFHTKSQLVKHAPSSPDMAAADGFEYAAFIGGMDVNTNRLDAPGHHSAAYREPGSFDVPHAHSYHDVHARVGGAATIDAFGVFRDRYLRDVRVEPPFPPPTATAFDAFAGEHIVQVSQTAFKAAPSGDAFAWAPDGNRTNWETFRKAIEAAREYIYIEDQYYVPDDGYVETLREASQHCQRLIILTHSSLGDIPFGDDRRQAIFQTLADPSGWGDRVLFGSPFRRPVLDSAARTASTGRLTLLADITAGDTEILVGPPARVPDAERFFFFTGGELMFAIGKLAVSGPDGQPAMRLDVLRGGVGTQPRWCPHPRSHRRGEPVTAAHPEAIYVHAKVMMVDDVFVGVGSMNLNRRGFFQDGEMVASALPAALAASADNPARKLRVALWAEHLGIDPAMGEALLGDPTAAYELFRRSRYQGNRFTPFREFLLPHASTLLPEMLGAILPQPIVIALEAAISGVLTTERTNIYNSISDPTSAVDPDPRPGPELP